jgi:hypothetical protein
LSTVTNANISGIVFTCTTNTYTVTANMVDATGDLYMYDEVNSASYYCSTYMENGSYTFPAEASGSTYDVAVHSPPAYQTCSVYLGNGTGTLTNANVTVDLYYATTYYLLTIDVTNSCGSDVTVYSGYEGGSIGSIASTGSVQPESFSEPGGSPYSVSASGPGCLCGFSGTTSGTMTGNVTLSGATANEPRRRWRYGEPQVLVD